MKRLLLAAATAACTFFMGTGLSSAQDGPPQFAPVELWACDYRDGKDQGDLQAVLEDLVRLSDDTPTATRMLSPYLRGPQQAMDFIYIATWPDGSTMGRDVANYLENGSDADAAWEDTVDCSASLLYARLMINQPSAEPDDDDNFILTVSDCKVAHGRSTGQAIGAIQRYNEYRVTNGSDITTLLWFPVYGGGGAEFDFKQVHVYNDYQHLGDSFQWVVDNQAYQVDQDMTDGLVSCDEARVYIGNNISTTL
jgi:hypothetical protein